MCVWVCVQLVRCVIDRMSMALCSYWFPRWDSLCEWPHCVTDCMHICVLLQMAPWYCLWTTVWEKARPTGTGTQWLMHSHTQGHTHTHTLRHTKDSLFRHKLLPPPTSNHISHRDLLSYKATCRRFGYKSPNLLVTYMCNALNPLGGFWKCVGMIITWPVCAIIFSVCVKGH